MSTPGASDQPLLSFETSPPMPVQELPEQEKKRDTVAKNFVRWCCNFGTQFRNSPDVTNLRYWAKKNKLQFKPGEEVLIVDTARRLFLKHVERLLRKSESAN